jgi:hypothetical protein
MSMLVWVAVGWLALAVLGWSWLAAAARADRAHMQRLASPRSRRPDRRR